MSQVFRHAHKIVCTLGRATNSHAAMEQLMKAGMNVARFNLSHGTYGEHTQAIRTLKKLTKATATPVGVLLDLPGPKYRTGKLKGGQAVLKRGAQLTITTRQIKGDAGLVSVNLTYTCARYQGGRYGIA